MQKIRREACLLKIKPSRKDETAVARNTPAGPPTAKSLRAPSLDDEQQLPFT